MQAFYPPPDCWPRTRECLNEIMIVSEGANLTNSEMKSWVESLERHRGELESNPVGFTLESLGWYSIEVVKEYPDDLRVPGDTWVDLASICEQDGSITISIRGGGRDQLTRYQDYHGCDSEDSKLLCN